MKKWGLVIDVAKCSDCNNCYMACKDEFVDNDWPPYAAAQPARGHRWMNILSKERGQYPKVEVAYLPQPCQHCQNAPCLAADQDGAVRRREDGIIIIDPDKAKGRKDLLKSCPYGAIFWNADKNLPQKCILCAHLLDEGWEKPRCVQVCPTGALQVEQLDDQEWAELKQAQGLQAHREQLGTDPRVLYKSLNLYTKGFIAGNVAFGDSDECAEGVEVTLRGDSGQELNKALTDNYGEFVLRGLEENGDSYQLEFVLPGRTKQTKTVQLKESLNLGTIFM
ncbi:MAG: oxidoreductase [Proteobacteria bacterium]|nr:oxidoreductase [Pseudomonadota bacterium]MBU1449576.1 oxidoreductase [Pseudomonadota bacterium]MBU2469026.1 oxidoreductase [Pseudomonadota bacterium]MBU2516873.1 oxidoreductase [Pseudomonadota bacterium]